MLQKLLKYLKKPSLWKERQEYMRLKRLPHYQPTTTTLLGKPMHLVDAPTYLNGLYEIFTQGIYTFQPGTPTPLIIDCGANIGLGVVAFKEQYPMARVLAYEADPKIAETLRKNVADRAYIDVSVNQMAVWTNNDGITFHQEGSFSGRIPKDEDSTRKIVKVPSIRLRDLLREYKHIDLLKIDIEGAELAVIPDCAEELHRAARIFLEYHSHENEAQELETLLAILVQNGFRYHIQEAFARKKPFVQTGTIFGMDNQLNIYAWKDARLAKSN